jgi:hypothetical protein
MKINTFISAVLLFLLPVTAVAATYQITTNAQGEAVLDRDIAPGGSHVGRTKTQVLQQFVNAALLALFHQHTARDSRALDDKLKVATNAARNNARTAINAGISPPVITPITDQTHNVGASPTIPIVTTIPYPDLGGLTYGATGLPPGMQVTSHPETGLPQITGLLTTAGTFNVTVAAWNFDDIKGTDAFVWTVNE